MSSVASAAPTLPGITSAPQRIPGRQTLPRALRAEWIKLRTLRSTWITTVLAIGLTALFGVSVAVGYASSEDQKLVAPHSITEGAPFGQIAVGVLAALVITAEYSSGQIRSSLGGRSRPGPPLQREGADRGRLGLRRRDALRLHHLGSLLPSYRRPRHPPHRPPTWDISGGRGLPSEGSRSWPWGWASSPARLPERSPR